MENYQTVCFFYCFSAIEAVEVDEVIFYGYPWDVTWTSVLHEFYCISLLRHAFNFGFKIRRWNTGDWNRWTKAVIPRQNWLLRWSEVKWSFSDDQRPSWWNWWALRWPSTSIGRWIFPKSRTGCWTNLWSKILFDWFLRLRTKILPFPFRALLRNVTMASHSFFDSTESKFSPLLRQLASASVNDAYPNIQKN